MTVPGVLGTLVGCVPMLALGLGKRAETVEPMLATVRPTRLIMMLPPPASCSFAAIVGQFGQHGASDAAACEGQGGFFLEAQRLRRAHTLVGERTPVQAHAMVKASGAAFDQGFRQRVSGQLSYHRVGGHMWWVDRPALFYIALLSGTTLNYSSPSADPTSIHRHDERLLSRHAIRQL